MNDFVFSTVSQIVSALGAAAQLGQHVRQRFPAASRALPPEDPAFAPLDNIARRLLGEEVPLAVR